MSELDNFKSRSNSNESARIGLRKNLILNKASSGMHLVENDHRSPIALMSDEKGNAPSTARLESTEER